MLIGTIPLFWAFGKLNKMCILPQEAHLRSSDVQLSNIIKPPLKKKNIDEEEKKMIC